MKPVRQVTGRSGLDHSVGEDGTARGLSVDVDGKRARPTPTRALARMATTGIYLVHGVPRDLQRAARARAVSEKTTLHRVLLQALREYAAGTWTPQAGDASPDSEPTTDLRSRLDRLASER
jgi:hypothetical protein